MSFFAALLAALLLPSLACGADPPALRVCADPNNLPYSNRAQQGFENKIAALIAEELDRPVAYTWWPQRRGFVRNTLSANRCDLVIGIPAGFDPVLTTRPYYRSTYVFVYPESADYQLSSLDDTVLRTLRIGVHLIGDDYANSPPAHALGAKGIVKNVVGYSVFGDYAEDNPPADLVNAVAKGEVDLAIVWGPIAGYFSLRQTPPLTIVPVVQPHDQAEFPFAYDIAMGVRHGEEDFRDALDAILTRRTSDILAILAEYGVPAVSGFDLSGAPLKGSDLGKVGSDR